MIIWERFSIRKLFAMFTLTLIELVENA
jgi:hypothetical protein